MRRWLIAATLLAVPVAAQEPPSTIAQYLAAKQAFLFGQTDIGTYLVDYRKHLFEGIEGVWYPASVLDPGSGDDALIVKACEKIGVHVAIRDEYTLAFVADQGRDTEVTTLYANRGGSAFGQYTDPAALLHRLGLDKIDNMEQATIVPLSSTNGLATIVRPSPDILVVQANFAVPQIYARCPAP